MKTIIVWYRNDLRVHDHPALAKAAEDADHVVPLFILNDTILSGRHAGSNRNRFLLECLEDLKATLKHRGGDLVIRYGDASKILRDVVKETKADAVYYTADYTSYAVKRDKTISNDLESHGIEVRAFAGRLIVSSIQKMRTKTDSIYKVFTPFWKNWMEIGRRELASSPQKISLPSSVHVGSLPLINDITISDDLSNDVLKGGETAGRKRLHNFIKKGVDDYHQVNNDMAADQTSRLSAYFHFGCISPLEAELLLPKTKGARAWNRQLAWREFYHYILLHFPDNAKHEFQEKFRKLKWGNDKKLLAAWQAGKTGYPIVDAAMRQLNTEGWMHNRGRLIVGSFLTKDLWLDWRLGETYFMRMLIDGDQANNNGNWQWIASVGADPAPVFRRFYNPASQIKKYDPSGSYVRNYVPELKLVPDKYLGEPWKMPEDVQQKAKCIIGKDYPAPIVDHAEARQATLEHYRQMNTY